MTKSFKRLSPGAAALLPLLLIACGTERQDGPPPSADPYPLAVGSYWVYDETDATGTMQIRHEVTDRIDRDFTYDAAGALPVWVVRTTFPSGGSDTDSAGGWRDEYLHDDGGRVVRLRHEVYDDLGALTKTRDYEPGFLRVDRGRTTVGDNWGEDLTRYSDALDGSSVVEETVSYVFEVLEPATVTVPAGTFDCLVVQRTDPNGDQVEVKIYYFAPGVGKVKEITGDGEKVEELSEYHVEPAADAGV